MHRSDTIRALSSDEGATPSHWQRAKPAYRAHDPADLREPLEPADGGIARKAALAYIVEQFVTVVRAEGQPPPLVAALAPTCLLEKQHFDHTHHVGIAGEMIRFHEATIRLFSNVA